MKKLDRESKNTGAKRAAKQTYQQQIGATIAHIRMERGWTQSELAKKVGTSQSAIHRIEVGQQNVSLEQIKRISKALRRQVISINDANSQSYSIHGGKELHGAVDVNTSKNAAVGLLCASLLNRGTTTLRNVARIEEVFRIVEVLSSIGVKCRWINDSHDLELISPDELSLNEMNVLAARKTRSIIMFMGPLLHRYRKFKLPFAGGCALGKRTVDPHLRALSEFGLEVETDGSGYYLATVKSKTKGAAKSATASGAGDTSGAGDFVTDADRNGVPDGVEPKKIVLAERGDTVTENALMAAALYPGETTIVGASPNYMVQDVCFFLERLGVQIKGIGTTTLVVRGCQDICTEVEYAPSEDPIEAMSFIAAGLVTHSEITVRRAPIEFLEIELEILRGMGAKIDRSSEYRSANGKTRLVDLQVHKSRLVAPKDKIHPMPFPGLNIDNLPFFSAIAAVAEGRTLIHDWVFENRAIYITELTKLNARVELLDAHRVYVEGPTKWRPAELVAPPALRPAVVLMIAMLAAPGHSILRNIYSINRGYEDFAARLNRLGADVTPLAGL